MKNFFSLNVKTKEETFAPYKVRSVSEQTTARQDESDDRLENAQKKSQLPLWLRIMEYLCLLTAACIFIGILRAFSESIGDESISSVWDRFVKNGIVIMMIVFVVCLVVGVALLIWGRKRYKAVLASPEYQTTVEEKESVQKVSYDELGVPADADEIDVFCFGYKLTKKGKPKSANPFAQYVTLNLKIFQHDDNICFADTGDLIEIPRSAITETYVLAKRVTFYGWTKEQSYKSQEYKPYKIRANNYGTLFIKGCYCIVLQLDGEQYEIIIPPYEWQVLEKYVELPKL